MQHFRRCNGEETCIGTIEFLFSTGSQNLFLGYLQVFTKYVNI